MPLTVRVPLVAAVAFAVALGLAAPGRANSRALMFGDADIAALQVGLRANRLYRGPVDGLVGAETTTAVRQLQIRSGLTPTGVPDLSTRAALGTYGATNLGDRPLALGDRGWDVAGLQFLLAWHGFPSSTLDGRFGVRTARALAGFQKWAGLRSAGTLDKQTIEALRQPPAISPLQLAPPIDAPATEYFGPRGASFHADLDFAAPLGAAVSAAADGTIKYAGWSSGGWGKMVLIRHADGVETLYAHLSHVSVAKGETVATGEPIGAVGATGDANGPHLHFEEHLNSAAIDPLSALRDASGSS